MATFIGSAIILSAFIGVGYYLYRGKQKATSACGSCAGCPSASSCQR